MAAKTTVKSRPVLRHKAVFFNGKYVSMEERNVAIHNPTTHPCTRAINRGYNITMYKNISKNDTHNIYEGHP